VLLPGIPVYSIIVRYNLLDAKVCGQGWANFWGVIFPWIISIFVRTNQPTSQPTSEVQSRCFLF